MKNISSSRRFATILAAAILFLLPFQAARSADVGPKPSMSFSFVYRIKPIPVIVSGVQLECSDPTCSDAAPLAQMGPQNFSCSYTTCNSLAYGYREYHRLNITFSDGRARLSNVFTKKAFAAAYKVDVRSDDLLVTETKSLSITGYPLFDVVFWACGGLFYLILWGLLIAYVVRIGKADPAAKFPVPLSILIGLVAAFMLIGGLFISKGLLTTVLIELLLGLGYALWRKRSLAVILTTILLLNLATQPALWVTISALNSSYSWIAILLAELVVWLAEAVGLYLVQRKSVKFTEMLLLSLVLNLASFLVGLFLAI